MSPLFCVIAFTGCAPPGHQCVSSKKTYFEQCGTNAIKRGENLWAYPLICPAQLLFKFFFFLPFANCENSVNISLFYESEKSFFRIYLIALASPLDHPLIECLGTLHRALVGVFGKWKNVMHTCKETFMEAMQTHTLRMTQNVYELVHHVPTYVRRTGTSE